MDKRAVFLTSAILLGMSSQCAAGGCEVVDGAIEKAVGAVGGIMVGTHVAAVAAPVTAVTHSSGVLILTGASGYIAHTIGVAASAWAVASAPVTAVIGAVVLTTSVGVVTYCRVAGRAR